MVFDSYSLRQEANNDILKIYFHKDKGEFFAKSVKFKYPRQRKTVVADGVGQGYKEVQEISPNLLTGLRNRHHLEDTLRTQMTQAMRNEEPLSCLMIDIDHFKSINDRFGHEAGDQVIKSVATIIQRAVHDSGLAFRYGGEEFLALLTDADEDAAHSCATQIYEGVRGLTLRYGLSEIGPVDVSIGIACYPQHAQGDNLLRAADVALYRAKELGRSRIVSFGMLEAG
jgi:diguanylate cyclase (GGDEF)-like protein